MPAFLLPLIFIFLNFSLNLEQKTAISVTQYTGFSFY